jgi:hypothetical protein
VFVALSAQDVLVANNHNLFVEASNVTKKGFDVKFSTTGKSQVWSAAASFIAFDSGFSDLPNTQIQSGMFKAHANTWGWKLAKGKGKRLANT